jgi:dTDP-4-amino-4,6-dideoxygalactose transaminase
MFAGYKDYLDIEGISALVGADDARLSEMRDSLTARLSARFGAISVFLFSSRRAALSVLLRALDVGVGDEVVIPALTDPAVADAVLSLKCIPHMVDVEPSRLAIKPTSLRRVLALGRSRLVIDMPLAGAVYDDEGVAALAAGYDVPFIADLSQSWPGDEPSAPNAMAVCFNLASGHPLVTGRGGALAVRDEVLSEKIETFVADIPPVSQNDDETALKGLLIQNRLLCNDIYDGSGAPPDLGYLYARKTAVSLDLKALFDEDYATIAAREALAEHADLTAPPERNFIRRFYRWLHPSSAVSETDVLSMGDLSAAIAELHFAAVEEDRERRLSLARLYRSELVRLDQTETADMFGAGTWPLRYPLLLGQTVSRTGAIRRCRDAGFEVGPFCYPRPLSGMFPYYKLCRHTAKYLRGAWRVASSLLDLPVHQEIDDVQAARLARVLKG